MFSLRLLVLSWLIWLSVAPVAAQSAPNQTPASPRTLPTLPQNVRSGDRLGQFRLTLPIERLALAPEAPGTVRADPYEAPLAPPSTPRPHPASPLEMSLRTRTMVETDTECFAIRSYRVTRDDPQSDATRPAGYSECQAANRYQVKSAADLREVAPR
ncbi:MAG: hypothetical protein ABSD75_14830 [Terriglobales bacterium]|jgi:hypothetical protein